MTTITYNACLLTAWLNVRSNWQPVSVWSLLVNRETVAMPGARNLAGGIVFTTVLYFSSFFGSIVLLMPFLPLIILKPKWARSILDFFLYMWFSFAVVSECSFACACKFVINAAYTDHPPNHASIVSSLTDIDDCPEFSALLLASYKCRYIRRVHLCNDNFD